MSIKTRLLLSYIAMTLIPVVLFAAIVATLAPVFLKDMWRDRQDGEPSVWQKSGERSEIVAGLKFMAQADPERFNDAEFLRSADERLKKLRAGLVVVKNGAVAYASPLADNADLIERLQKLRPDEATAERNDEKIGHYSVEQADIAFGGGSVGKVILLSDISLDIEGAKKLFPLLVLTLLLVVGLTNGILTFLVSRSLIKPLNTLRRAAEQIKDGDLSREVKLKRKDEIGKVGAAFEEMRVRLGESIRLQMQYEENRKELISNISHDLKTPIAGIKACVEGLQDGIADTQTMRDKYIGMIAKKTNEMDRLIDELFLFSKLDLKRLPFHLEPIDLAAYLRDCASELRLDPRMEGFSVIFDYAGEEPVRVVADREKLRRVVMNIVDNSLKYMDKEKKEIRFDLADGDREATVVVRDNGSGIDSKALPHIFDRFYRAEPSRNKETGGSGLGLAIVKQMVEGQGGRVWAESRAGEGTSIYLTLPKTEHGGERP
jgi:signal transduction histidine kinase